MEPIRARQNPQAPRVELPPQRARHREIARRYAWHAVQRQGTSKRGLKGNLRLGELRRLFRHRYRVSSTFQADALIHKLVGHRVSWSTEKLGQFLQLTFVERWNLDIRTIRCFDKSPHEIRLERREAKRLAEERRRRRAGKITRAEYRLDMARKRTEIPSGMSRATFYRSRKKTLSYQEPT